MEKITIIDFVEKYTRQWAEKTYLREKVGDTWTETSFDQTRKEAYRLGAGLMALGLGKGERVALLSEARNMCLPPSHGDTSSPPIGACTFLQNQ